MQCFLVDIYKANKFNVKMHLKCRLIRLYRNDGAGKGEDQRWIRNNVSRGAGLFPGD